MGNANDESSSKYKEFILQFLDKFKAGVGLMAMVIVMSFLSDRFLTLPNILNIFRQVSIMGIMAVGMTMVILAQGIDLSVGSLMALSGAVTAGMMVHGDISIFLAVLTGLAVGTALGLFNGLMISKAKLPDFIVTLAMMSIARGLTLVYTGGRPISGFDLAFRRIGGGRVGRVPIPVIIFTVILIIGYLVLNKTTFGRYIYAVGGNKKAARLAGINTDRVKILVYAISGFLSAVSGVILISRLNSAQPTAGVAYELDVIAMVVLGGTSLVGGKGTVGGTLIGALIIGVLNNSLNLLGVASFYQEVAKGLVILVAVLLDSIQHRD
ncbi:ribose ABC transporter membrane protein [Halarsenatibacter silvermanii]|uniref:Ribose ABC transporter membrane protein n=2 Tax=Halarsenatibacter silvermanii TaxID=321763 RepID=A0A1G9S4Q8_9FIRM|nr:ribose ABC transporter membrane protein [Halarsenatibacter silvermanii]